MPTDVHPQAYQPGAVGPPGPQWAGSAPQQTQPPPGPPPAPGANGWGRLSDVNPPPQPPNPYEAREPFRGPAPPIQRQPSPRAEQQMRQYSDPARPSSLRRGPSPPPTAHYPPPPPPLSQQAPPNSQPARVQNPNYVPTPSSAGIPPSSVANGPPPPQNTLGPYRPGSPRPDGRPMHDNRMPSPKSAYPQHQPPYPPHPEPVGPSGIEAGAPAPQAAMTAEALHRENDRPPSVGPKRMREWEDEPAVKKPASEENRARLEDLRHRRPSTPPREPYRRNSSEARRFEDQRRMEDQQRRADEQRRADDMRRAEEHQRHANDSYHPSEAAHHPPSHSLPGQLPPIQQGPTPMQGIVHEGAQPGPASKEFPGDDRQRMEPSQPPHPPAANEPERAARRMDVDEDYDDSGEDEKKNGAVSGPASGPGSASGEIKTATPTSAGVNGMAGPKVEAA